MEFPGEGRRRERKEQKMKDLVKVRFGGSLVEEVWSFYKFSNKKTEAKGRWK